MTAFNWKFSKSNFALEMSPGAVVLKQPGLTYYKILFSYKQLCYMAPDSFKAKR